MAPGTNVTEGCGAEAERQEAGGVGGAGGARKGWAMVVTSLTVEAETKAANLGRLARLVGGPEVGEVGKVLLSEDAVVVDVQRRTLPRPKGLTEQPSFVAAAVAATAAAAAWGCGSAGGGAGGGGGGRGAKVLEVEADRELGGFGVVGVLEELFGV